MKKIIILIMILLSIIISAFPVGALGSPTTDGSYAPPPSPDANLLTASYDLMRSYSDVTTVFVRNSTQPSNVLIDGAYSSYYLTYMFSTPNTMVAPSSNGYGDIDDYGNTSGFYSTFLLSNFIGNTGGIQAPSSSRSVELVVDGSRANSLLYSFTLNSGSSNNAYQYGVITGEWDDVNINNIVSGYGIRWSAAAQMTLTVTGNISYGNEGHNIISTDIDRNYVIQAGEVFYFNPQSLLQYEDTINFDYYVFTGNWTIHSDTAGYIVEYKAYDSANVETVDYLSGYNEYTNQSYSIDLYPIARICNKLSSSSGTTPTGTLTVNSAGVHDVTNYQYIDVDIPPFSLYYNGDINNGTYEHEQTWQGVDIDILMDIGNTFERGSSVDISGNGDTNVGRYEFAKVDVPQTVIDDVNAFDWLFGAVNGFLEMEILPDFSIGGILLFAAGLALLIWILKIFLGG